jgi:D-alanyl-D-alanine carboxypeptidase/D-alanyl-D-alanine-endopeptidase (penicillin-binding protein 4)
MRNLIYILTALLFLISCSSKEELLKHEGRVIHKIKVSDLNISELPKEFAVLNDPRSGAWSVTFYDLDKKKYLFDYNKNKNLLPASNLKVITNAAALKILGPDETFSTNFYIDGYIDKKLNLLKGNLYIEGTGDPSTGNDFLRNRSLNVFKPLLDSLRLSRGIDYIEGRIIPLNPFRLEDGFGKGWDIDDLPNYYSAVVSPLVFHENLTKVTVNKNGVKIIPYYPFRVRLDTVPDVSRTQFTRLIGSDSLLIRSDFTKPASGFITVNDPDKFYIDNLAEYLASNKVKVQNNTREAAERFHLCTIKSDSLFQMIDKCNSESNNLYAEQIFRRVAQTFSKDSSFADSLGNFYPLTDLTEINSKLYERLFGIDNFNLADGSGLSRMNFFSSENFIKVLDTMYEDANFISYLSSFPVPGANGTLQYRMTDPDLQNRLFAKTGSMTGVNCLTGFLYTKNGSRIAFSIMNNYYNFGRNKTYNIFEDMLLYFVNNY